MSSNTVLWLMLVSIGQLLVPAMYILLFVNEQKYTAYVELLRIIKILGIFVSCLIIVKELIIDNGFWVLASSVISTKQPLLIVLSTIFFDLIFLYFLLSYKMSETRLEDASLREPQLPEYKETIVSSEDTKQSEDK
jgi:hypothetical protein